jgi:hypothetical protein
VAVCVIVRKEPLSRCGTADWVPSGVDCRESAFNSARSAGLHRLLPAVSSQRLGRGVDRYRRNGHFGGGYARPGACRVAAAAFGENHHWRYGALGCAVILLLASGTAGLGIQIYRAGQTAEDKVLCRIDAERLRALMPTYGASHPPVLIHYGASGGEESERCALQISYALNKLFWAAQFPQMIEKAPEEITIMATENFTGLANDLKGALSRIGIESSLDPKPIAGANDYMQIIVGQNQTVAKLEIRGEPVGTRASPHVAIRRPTFRLIRLITS